MSIILCVILFVAFSLAQFLLNKKVNQKVVKHIPVIISAMITIFAVGLHIYARITYEMGAVSESVLAENQYFAMFICVPALISFAGSLVGLLIGKAKR